MNPIEQIEAEKLATEVVRRANALTVLAAPNRISKWAWTSPVCLAFIGLIQSGGLTWLMGGKLVPLNPFHDVFVSILAWGGFSLAALAYQEARENRKRLEAALALLDLT
ncbi:hypothetical protein [uncultured Deefgea sp.]|uniref:hypothetical protein n=1 Tax=uncultured Deefgea sp. TaxID=1304914 RepID=UPI002594F77D|nr:hypothetical protein [uncultured Deefgea sp.]